MMRLLLFLPIHLKGSIQKKTRHRSSLHGWDNMPARSRYARKTNAVPLTSATSEWNHLLNPGSSSDLPGKEILDVEPMITSNWDQPYPYNEMCPADPAGSQRTCHCRMCSCGNGPDHVLLPLARPWHRFLYLCDSTYGIQHVSFDSTWYRWNNMKNTITTSDTGIAQLIYHLGVSVDLKYGPAGSGMYNHHAAYALKTYFKYSPETSYVYRDSTNLNWDSLIIAHLNRGMPLYYAGWSVPNIDGHAFVCDGYQSGDYFHFNFGWSGTDNGYYYLDNITPGGYNFNLAQELIINIYPDTLNYTYPPYCSGATTLTLTRAALQMAAGLYAITSRNRLQLAHHSPDRNRFYL